MRVSKGGGPKSSYPFPANAVAKWGSKDVLGKWCASHAKRSFATESLLFDRPLHPNIQDLEGKWSTSHTKRVFAIESILFVPPASPEQQLFSRKVARVSH